MVSGHEIFVDYFSVDDPFTHDIAKADLDQIGNLYAVGEAPNDDVDVAFHNEYQRNRITKIDKFEKYLKLWDKGKYFSINQKQTYAKKITFSHYGDTRLCNISIRTSTI